MIYACVILVAGSCPIPEGCCEDEREKNEEERQKKGTCYARIGALSRGETDEEDGDEVMVGARYCLETPCAGTLLL